MVRWTFEWSAGLLSGPLDCGRENRRYAMKRKLSTLLILSLVFSLTVIFTSCDVFDFDDDDMEQEQVITDFGEDQGQDAEQISPEKAAEIALEKVPGATKDDVYKLVLDVDDGRTVYEGEIYYEQQEYEFEIDATSGEILEFEMDN